MSSFKIEVQGINKAVAALTGSAERIKEAVRVALYKATMDLTRYVKEQKLSDQVLRVRTGRLRRSITGRVEDSDGKFEGIVGTNVRYARVHELGFKGVVQVKAHIRRIKGQAIPVRSHSRKLDLPARPFLNPSLQERFPQYQQQFVKAVQEGARGTGA